MTVGRERAKKIKQRSGAKSPNGARASTTPGRLSPEQREKFLEALAVPIPLRHACALAGIPRNTVNTWLAKGTSPNATDVYRQFAEDVADAMDYGIADLARDIRSTSSGDPKALKAATWYLSRMAPDEFGDPGKRSTAEDDKATARANRERAEHEARLAKAKADAAEALTETAGGLLIVGLEYLLGDGVISPAARAEVERALLQREARTIEARDLTKTTPDEPDSATD